MKTRIALRVVIVGLAVVSAVAQPSASRVRMIRPNELAFRSVPGYPPGYERAVLEREIGSSGAHTYRVRIPPHFRARPHTHPSDEHVTVLKGTWYFGVGREFDEGRMQAFEPGSFVFVPAGVPHYVMTGGEETLIQAHGVGPIGIHYVTEDRR